MLMQKTDLTKIKESKTRAVSVCLDTELFLDLLTHCAKKGLISLRPWFREAIIEKLANEREKKPTQRSRKIMNDSLLQEILNHPDFYDKDQVQAYAEAR